MTDVGFDAPPDYATLTPRVVDLIRLRPGTIDDLAGRSLGALLPHRQPLRHHEFVREV